MTLEDTGIAGGAPEAAAAKPRLGGGLSREAGMLVAGLFVIAGAFLYPYVEGIADAVMPGCLFHRVTGIPCLLCGMTRSFAAAAHGHLLEAFRLHLLGPPFFILVLLLTALLIAEYALSRRILPRPGTRVWRHLGWGTLGLLAAAWVARLIAFGVNV